MNPKISDIKSDVSCDASVNFHHMPQSATPAVDLQVVTLHAALAMNSQNHAQHHMLKILIILHLPRKMTMEVSKVVCLVGKNENHLLKTMQKYCACHTDIILTRYETCCNMSQAVPATRDEVARRLKHLKVTTFAALAIGKAMLPGRRSLADTYERLRTAADGCGHKSTVERTRFNLQTQTPKVKRERHLLPTHSGIQFPFLFGVGLSVYHIYHIELAAITITMTNHMICYYYCWSYIPYIRKIQVQLSMIYLLLRSKTGRRGDQKVAQPAQAS